MNTAAVDSATIWLSEALLPESAHEADRLAIAQIRIDNVQRPLDDLLEEVREEQREEPGQFGLGYATALLFPWLLAGVHAFVKTFAKKFVEGAASEAGKMTATALKGRIALALSNEGDPNMRRDAVADLEHCLVGKAREMNLPKASYEEILQHIRNNPQLVL